MRRKNAQHLTGSNRSINFNEALAARVKDPLWFLARQWQAGEFEGEDGGKLADIQLKSHHFPTTRLFRGGSEAAFDPDAPLEYLVESEDTNSTAWDREALEYRFDLQTTGQKLTARDYPGFEIDWYHFDYEGSFDDVQGNEDPTESYVPTQLQIPGAPESRWWYMEDAEAFFDSPQELEPNILSTLLPEFLYTDIFNWYIIPAPMPAGSVRHVDQLTATDSFNVVTDLFAFDDKDWRMFTIDPAEAGGDPLPHAALFAPNVALDILHNDVIEDVRFVRDEQSNLVWAWEHCVTTDDGTKVFNGDIAATPETADDGTIGYTLMSGVAQAWIPYVARFIARTAGQGDIYLRRGRTDPDADESTPQYTSQIVGESERLYEEEIPRTGLRVRRISKFAYGPKDRSFFWVGRQKDAGRGISGPGLAFDTITPGDTDETS